MYTVILFSYVEHLMYAMIWLYPEFFNKLNFNPKKVHKFLIAVKFIGISLAIYQNYNMINIYYNYLCMFGIAMVAFGQFLNLAVYRAIGFNGVYYGNKFGINIPYCTKFPYNTNIKHPQYIGAYTTYIGLWFVFMQKLSYMDFTIFSVLMALSYIMISIIEGNF